MGPTLEQGRRGCRMPETDLNQKKNNLRCQRPKIVLLHDPHGKILFRRAQYGVRGETAPGRFGRARPGDGTARPAL